MTWTVPVHKDAAKQLKAIPTDRRIPTQATRIVEVLALLLSSTRRLINDVA
jgi:hypothetical protein